MKRSAYKDLLGGIDPTGKFTFRYGIQDAGEPARGQKLRRTLGVLGGTLGGAVALPSLYSGVVGTMQAVDMLARRRPPKDALRHIWNAVKAPVAKPFHAARLTRALGRAGRGLAPRAADIAKTDKAIQSLGSGLPETVRLMLKGNEPAASLLLQPKAWSTVGKPLHQYSRDKLRDALIVLGLAGAVSGGSSFAQHSSGVRYGKKMTPEARRTL